MRVLEARLGRLVTCAGRTRENARWERVLGAKPSPASRGRTTPVAARRRA
jgi:hypothetical protein